MVSEMKEQLQSGNPDRAKLQRVQRETFSNRCKWMLALQDTDVQKMIAEYPILGDIYFVSI